RPRTKSLGVARRDATDQLHGARRVLDPLDPLGEQGYVGAGDRARIGTSAPSRRGPNETLDRSALRVTTPLRPRRSAGVEGGANVQAGTRSGRPLAGPDIALCLIAAGGAFPAPRRRQDEG